MAEQQWVTTPAGTEVDSGELLKFAAANDLVQDKMESRESYIQRVATVWDAREDDEDEDDLDDVADDVFSALRDAMPRKRVPNGEYTMAVSSVKYTEMPYNQGPSYATFTLVVSQGRYKGKTIQLRVNSV